ncbi:uncharacterized protein ACNLHF_002833 isoform 1-T1 [Anomaloglossus baeobatrachus]|uniref:uncharacterized protein LOC142256094 isoform X1 n=1 Tax=Anomaloglossus baeobatrachus TaxID=238106 RepID=UPI003F4FD67F
MNVLLAEAPTQRQNALALRRNCQQSRQTHLRLGTPVSVAEMGPWLDRYPNKDAAAQLRFGFSFGFFIPFKLNRHPLFARNLKSATELHAVLLDKINCELEKGRLKGPFESPPFYNLRVSPLGVVPKKEPGKFRLIHHLSHPKGLSVNDGIPDSDASVTYVSFDKAVALVRQAGPGALMAKSDIESAFRLLPVHPDCYHLLGCFVDGFYYYDTCLPMGCSISCSYFELFSSFLEWAVKVESGSQSIIHYLDDFLFVGPQDSTHCQLLLDSFCSLMSRFGVPLSKDKTVGPSQVLSFLGIEIDSNSMLFRLPDDKVVKLRSLIMGFCSVRSVTLRQMQSLLGLLVFACRVMPMGRVFSRRLSLATKGIRLPHHRIRITPCLRADLFIWNDFLSRYNGQTCFQDNFLSNEEISLFSDASGSLGFGVIFGEQWCAEQWPQSWHDRGFVSNLTLLELFPIVTAVVIWGPAFRNKRILFWTDNMSVVHAINHLTSSSLPVLKLLRFFVLQCLELNMWFRARHVPGRCNAIADSLSRFQFQKFRQLCPRAQPEGMSCPPSIWDLLECS